MATCRTVLIDDAPSADDAFQGPHRRVADAIAAMIASEKGGKVVGLEGGWGSGKSTVVNMIRLHFEDAESVAVIAFDAWAHEGDPLRRTYLERVIRQLQSKTWVRDDYWNEQLERISHRKRNSKSKTATSPTKFGRHLAWSALVVPFGTALVAAAIRNGVTAFRPDLPVAWWFVIGSMLSLSPALIILGHLLRNCLSSERADWSLVAQNETTAFTETTESPNPTSIEFEEHFASLVGEALNNDSKRQLVLIVDNLDRVDAANALAIWSTLQTFLQEQHHRSKEWFERLWVLVPFDPRGLRALWDRDAVALGDAGKKEERPPNGSTASDSFFDKSFQVRFYIAPPVLSDWRKFLDDLLKIALPDHGEDDRHMVYRVYEHCTRHRVEPPTPRQLKLFVNQIGAVHRQWSDQFPLGHIAYFVLARREHETLIEELRRAKLPTSDDVRMLGDAQLGDSIAGLLFNVLPNKGRELLLADLIRKALFEDGDLSEVAENHPQGFWPVLESVVPSALHGSEIRQLGEAAIRLGDSGLLGTPRQEARTVLRSLKRSVSEITSASPWGAPVAEGLAALCRLLRDEDVSKRLFAVAASAMAEDAKPEIEVAVLVRALHTILRVADELKHVPCLPKELKLPLGAAEWRQACVELAKSVPQRHWKRIGPTVGSADVLSDLQARVVDGTFAGEDITELSVSGSSALVVGWDDLIPTFVQRLDASQGTSTPQVCFLLEGLWEIFRLGSQPASEAVANLVGQGHIAHHLQNAKKHGDRRCIALCVFTSLSAMPDGGPPSAVGASQAGHQFLTELLASQSEELAKQLVDLSLRFVLPDWLPRVIDSKRPCDPLVADCLNEVVRSERAQKVYSTERFIEHWRVLSDALEDGKSNELFAHLVRSLNEREALSNAISAGDFVPEDAQFYAVIVAVSAEDSMFLTWCQKGLGNLSKEDWFADLTGPACCYRLALLLIESGRIPSLTTDFSDALEAHARRVMGDQRVPTDLSGRLPSLLDCLADDVRQALRARLLGAAVSRDGKIGDSFFVFYGNEIVDAADFCGANTVTHLFSPLVRERNQKGLLWLRDLLEANSTCASIARQQGEFIARLQRHVDEQKEEQEQADVAIAEIANRLGVYAREVDEHGEGGDVGDGGGAEDDDEPTNGETATDEVPS